jgi:hypothetical protein
MKMAISRPHEGLLHKNIKGSCHMSGMSSHSILVFTAALFIAALMLGSIAAGKDYDIIANMTPDYGYGDTRFSYSARVQLLSEDTATYSGKWQMELKIYDGEKELASKRMPSDPRILRTGEWQAQMTLPFDFGSFNFENDFGIIETKNASYELIAYRDGAEAVRARGKGPLVQPPSLDGDPNYNNQPYFVEPLKVTASFKDKEGASPTCYLELKGPLGSPDEDTWNSESREATASGTTYTFILGSDVDLSRFRDGANLSFTFVYNNAQSTVREGPFPVTVRPYRPTIEPIEVRDPIEYTNFTIRAYVDDVGRKVQGDIVAGSRATVEITNPKTGSRMKNSTESRLIKRGDRSILVFEWTKDQLPFVLNDVNLSKDSPFTAVVEYTNDNWEYNASRTSRSFRVVREIPLVRVEYNRSVYIRGEEPAVQRITANVAYSKGMGEMWLSLKGKDRQLEERSNGVDLGGNRYKYTWDLSFNNSSVGNKYDFSMRFVHPSLEGNEYALPDKFNFTVTSIMVEFKEPNVSPMTGQWNQAYTYTATVNASVGGVVVLRIYDPCIRDWTDWKETRRIYPGSDNKLSFVVARPFKQDCPAMQDDPPMYAFKAILDRPYESEPNEGPYIGVAMPKVNDYGVDPDVGRNDDRFNFTISLNFGKKAVIELQTYNPQINQYETRRTRDYVNPGNNQTLSWELSFPEEFQGKRLSYKFRYQGVDIASGNGPTVQLGGLPKIHNVTVDPVSGSSDMEYT